LAAAPDDATADVEPAAILEMCADLREHRTAVVRMQDVLECEERIREILAVDADDVAEAFGVPHDPGRQVPVVEAIGRAAHGAFPATLDVERVELTLLPLGDVAQNADDALGASVCIASHDARVRLEPFPLARARRQCVLAFEVRTLAVVVPLKTG